MTMIAKSWVTAGLTIAVALASAPAAAASWAEIVAAAEKEGKISVVTPPTRPHRETALEFQKAYPKIAVSATGMPASEFDSRIEAERRTGVYAWDVMIGGLSLSTYTSQIPQGWFVPLRDTLQPEVMKDELWLGGFEAGFMDKGKKFVYAFAANLSNSFLVNRSIIPESELNSFADLLNPKWKGKIAFYDPRIRGPGGFAFARYYQAEGPEKAALLLRQDIATTATTRQAVEWVIRGNYPISIGASEADLKTYHSTGIGLDVKPLPMPDAAVTVVQSWGGLGAFANAPHPNAQLVFINWLLSKEGQTDWAVRGNVNSRRLDVPKGYPETAPTASQFLNGVKLSREESMEIRRKAVELATEVLQR